MKKILFKILISSVLVLTFSNAKEHKMFQTVNPSEATLVKTDSTKKFCNVCGMHLTKFYKTSHVTEFKNGHKEQYCSIHCQAQIDNDFKDKIKNIKVVDTNSLKLIDAKKAFYVVGSSKKGTMTPISKYAFSSKSDADKFQKQFGGKVYNFEKTLQIAKDGLNDDFKMIHKKRVKMAQKGKKIYSKMCKQNIQKDFNSIGEAKRYLIENKSCKNLKPKMLQAVSIYLFNPVLAVDKSSMIKTPKDTKCPVCGMFVAKYPKWVAKISLDKKEFYFDGVKDMMKFYFSSEKFGQKVKPKDIKSIKATDFYTLKEIDAKKAFYVIGSNIYGPMGEELIPFDSEKKAKKFLADHFGKKILKFDEIKESFLY